MDEKYVSVRTLLSHTSIESLLSTDKVITLHTTDTIAAACEVLVNHGITSAPVWDVQDHSYKGLLDINQLCQMLFKLYEDQSELLIPDVQLSVLMKNSYLQYAQLSVLLSEYSYSHGKMVFIYKNQSLWDATEIFLKNENSVHRVLVLNDEQKCCGVISQSDVLKFLHMHIKEFHHIGDIHIDQIASFDRVFTLDWNKGRVIDALRMMHDNNTTSIGLISEGGELESVITMADIRYILKNGQFDLLKELCAEFIRSVRYVQSIEERHGKDVFPYFGIHRECPLNVAMGKLVATRTHRLFVVADRVPVGVLRLTDILRYLVGEPKV